MLNLKSVCFSYNGEKVLDSVSLDVNAREFLGIIGPNGAGKSTLLRIMSNILHPSEGEVFFDHRKIETMTVKEIARNIAVLPAETLFSYDFTVLEIVKMGRAPHLNFWSDGGEQDLKIVRGSLEAVGIQHLSQRNIHSLSSGEKQRVFLAQAMTQQPKVLLLDEPTVHLDIQHQIQILKLLKVWNQTGKLTVVLISHDLNLASQFCGRLVLFNHGSIVSDGTPKEVITEKNIQLVYGIKTKVIDSPSTGLPTVIFE